MRKLLSGLAIAALVAGTANAQPGGGNGKGRNEGGKARSEHRMERADRQNERRPERQPVRLDRQQAGRQQAGRQQAGRQQAGRQQAGRQQERRVERPQQQQPQHKAGRSGDRHAQRVERSQHRQIERRVERRAPRMERSQQRQAGRRAGREAGPSTGRMNRPMVRNDRGAGGTIQREDSRIAADRIAGANRPGLRGSARRLMEGCPPGLARKNDGCMPPGLARQDHAPRDRAAAVGAGPLATTLNPSWFGYDDYGPDYRYYDGYLLRTSGDRVMGYVPLLGGALAPGQPWQPRYDPAPIPTYWADYYGMNSIDRYRYYDNAIFELGSGYSEIDRIVALLAGDSWAIGSPMPYGYDVYNVPYSYRTRYYDTPDHWYRYADGYVYDIDPSTRLVLAVLQLLGGGTPTVGQPWLSSYQPAPIPPYWSDYYGLRATDRYRYYDDVIYELDPAYGEIDAIVAVTAGDPWSVGSRMPYGYDVYNVPYAYRERYYDRPDHWYRYSDGYIYDIDPTTRLVLAAVQLLA